MARYSPDNVVAHLSRSPLYNLVAAIIGGLLIGTVEYAVMQVDLAGGVPPLMDAAIMAGITGVLLFVVLREWRLRRELVLKQLRVVAELNHQVRNALQPLAYSQYLSPQQQTDAVLQTVNRIDATLRELVPVIEDRVDIPEHVRASLRLGRDRRRIP